MLSKERLFAAMTVVTTAGAIRISARALARVAGRRVWRPLFTDEEHHLSQRDDIDRATGRDS